MKSYILWDHDGVLVDTEQWYFEATRQCIRPFGIEIDKTQYLRDMAAGRSAWEQVRDVGATEQQIRLARARRDAVYQDLLRSKDIEIAGVVEVLEELAERYAMAIVTTAKRADFELIHAGRQIVRHMQFVLTNGDYARSKPAPDPYIAALERFGAAPEEAIVVEDSERGLGSAVAAGIDCVVVANVFVEGQDFSRACHRIAALSELPALIDSL